MVVDTSPKGLRVWQMTDLASDVVGYLSKGTIIETDELIVIQASDGSKVPRVHLADGQGWTSVNDGCGMFFLREVGHSAEEASQTKPIDTNEDYFKPKQLNLESVKSAKLKEKISPVIPANAAVGVSTALKIITRLDGGDRNGRLKRFCQSFIKAMTVAVPVVPVLSPQE